MRFLGSVVVSYSLTRSTLKWINASWCIGTVRPKRLAKGNFNITTLIKPVKHVSTVNDFVAKSSSQLNAYAFEVN